MGKSKKQIKSPERDPPAPGSSKKNQSPSQDEPSFSASGSMYIVNERSPLNPSEKNDDLKMMYKEDSPVFEVQDKPQILERTLADKEILAPEEEEKNIDKANAKLVPSPSTKAKSMAGLHYDPIFLRDPRKFQTEGHDYSQDLRFKDIRFVVSITMYNEAPEELILSVRGVCEGIKAFAEKIEDPDLWRKFVCVIITDGRSKFNPETAEMMKNAGLFDPKMLHVEPDMSSVGAHMFQTTATFVDDPAFGTEYPPLQSIFLMKEHNAGKIDSHWWLFEGLCESFKSEYVVLLDVGTRPLRKSLYHIYRCFERNHQIAGICGELTTREVGTVSTLVAAQHFEYKVASLLDRTIESVCGYISVLPGCFSAYRFEALKGTPLRKYFKSRENPEPLSAFEANVYLVEDRVLCMELFAKQDYKSTLHYERMAIAEQDSCLTLEEFMKQRRRWINGTTMAVFLMITEFYKVLFHKKHTFIRKIFVTLDFFYYCFMLLSQWVLPGVYLLFIDLNYEFILWRWPAALLLFRIFFWTLVILQFPVAMSGKLNKRMPFYFFSQFSFGVIYFVMSVFVIYFTVTGEGSEVQTLLIVATAVNIGAYFVVGFMHGEFITLIASFCQWWFTLPTYVLILSIYAFCNLNDISWGTKSIDQSAFTVDEAKLAEKKRLEKSYSDFRDYILIAWIFTNILFFKIGRDSYIINGSESFARGFFLWMTLITLAFIGVRLFFSIVYVFTTFFAKRVELRQNLEEVRRNRTKRSIRPENNSDKNDKPSKVRVRTWKHWLLFVVLTAPFNPQTWISICNLLVFNPVFGIPSILWTAVSFVASFLTIWTPLSPYVFGFAAATWRKLALWEFSYNSFDGSFALGTGYRNRNKTGVGRSIVVDRPLPLEEQSLAGIYTWVKKVLNDSLTWKAFFFFVYIKPLTLFLSTGLAAAWFIGSLLFLINAGMVLTPTYMPHLESIRISSEPALGPLFAVIGVLLFVTFFEVVSYLDYMVRRVVTWSLSVPITELRSRADIKKEQSPIKTPPQSTGRNIA